ncbi:hypothetical protein [Paractinoplanes lichenicola]|uniref:Alpha/beta hydrolase n=1 Tax=Paractinoplanes lichenicola TaxID=2802976 RepID=A0ABS1W5Z1_9ACTN|nr:hypothetical protein [Actinoplanes lichenicola]MBL7262159.1 hypothetical protein [Actinoplanes lichenicola]
MSVQDQQWRYTIRRPEKPTKKTVIVDFGGPGVPVLAADYLSMFRATAPAIFERYNVIALDEPWSVKEISQPCQDSLSSFYEAVRQATLDEAAKRSAALRDECELQNESRNSWGFDASSYAALLEAVEQKEDLSYVGFIGQSFGSTRLSYLSRSSLRQDLRWAILSRPFPVGASAEELFQARGAAVRQSLKDLRPDQGNPRRAADTSPGATFDRLSAEIELGYLYGDSQDEAAADVFNGVSETLTRLSGQLWQRYGEDEISPAYLAQLDELCNALGPSEVNSIDAVEDVLSAQLMPCRSAGATPTASGSLGSIPLCVSAADDDTVAPGALAKRKLESMSTETMWLDLTSAPHFPTDGVERCLAGLAQRITDTAVN